MGDNTTIIRFNDLCFKPHPMSQLFEKQAIVILKDGHRISVVGPRTQLFLFNDSDCGKYEILYTGWDDPLSGLSVEQVDFFLVKIQKTPLDLLPEIGKHKFI